MLTIDTSLAQDIVLRTMHIMPFKVNVIDVRGVILASGSPERIGDLHPGAQLALARRASVEIDELAASKLPGAKPGINLPLMLRGEIFFAITFFMLQFPEQLRLLEHHF